MTRTTSGGGFFGNKTPIISSEYRPQDIESLNDAQSIGAEIQRIDAAIETKKTEKKQLKRPRNLNPFKSNDESLNVYDSNMFAISKSIETLNSAKIALKDKASTQRLTRGIASVSDNIKGVKDAISMQSEAIINKLQSMEKNMDQCIKPESLQTLFLQIQNLLVQGEMKFMTTTEKQLLEQALLSKQSTTPSSNATPDATTNVAALASPFEGGGYVTVLGRKRKVVAKGRVECVMVKGKLTPLKEAKAAERKRKA